MKKISSIRLQFWLPLSIFTAFTVLLFLFSFLQYLGFRRNLEERTVVFLQERLTQVGNRIDRLFNNNLQNLVGFEIGDLNISNEVQSIALIDEKGIVIDASMVEWKGLQLKKYLPSFNEHIFQNTQLMNRQEIRLSADGDHVFVYEPILLTALPGEIRSMNVGLLFVDYNLSEIKAGQLRIILSQSYFVWGIGLFLMILFYIALRFWLTKPFHHLHLVIGQFGAGNYSTRINITGHGELAEVGNAFNQMADEVSNHREWLQAVVESKIQIEKELLISKQKAEESDRLKSAFLANMSHEIRTPMNGIIGFTELLDDKSLSVEDRNRFIAIVHKSSQQLLSIINDLIDISKIEAGQETLNPEAFNLDNFLDDLFSFFQPLSSQRNLLLRLQKESIQGASFIRCDTTKLRQILINLLGNALKFTTKGSIKFGYHIEGQNIIFQVVDTGIGVDPEFRHIIFDRFRQAGNADSIKYGGTGLGLAISKSYVEMMGGEIWVESPVGGRSRFIFTLPYDPVSVAPKIIKSSAGDHVWAIPDWHDKTIMIVEDIEDNAFLIKQMLKVTRISVIMASNGLEAIEVYKNHPEISLVLMDIKMPEMDGYQATQNIKMLKQDIPVIAATAYSLPDDRAKCLAAGCDDYLAKPIIKEQFLTLISRYLDS